MKWSFTYSQPANGKRGHIKVTASSKPEAIRKGMEHAQKHTDSSHPIKWDCKPIMA